MIFHRENEGLRLIPIDLLGVAAIAYMVSGLLYGYYVLNITHHLAVWSSIGCLIGWCMFRRNALKNSILLVSFLKTSVIQRLILLSLVGISGMVIFFIYFGSNYLLSDKVLRSETINQTFFIRIPFYASILCAFVLFTDKECRYRKTKSLIFYLILIISLLEMNRELLLAVGLLYVFKHYQLYHRLLIPSGFIGLITILVVLIFFLVLIKPILYLTILGTSYDGGFLNFGETINWYKWLDYSAENNIDLTVVQRNDGWYSLFSLILPYSPVESASAIWFREILGNTDIGRTFGYSGVLWLSHYFSGAMICLPWILIFYFYSLRWCQSNIVNIIIGFGLCLISFRFFRSEWPLVLKTYLWTFLYPGLVYYTLSRLSFRKTLKNEY